MHMVAYAGCGDNRATLAGTLLRCETVISRFFLIAPEHSLNIPKTISWISVFFFEGVVSMLLMGGGGLAVQTMEIHDILFIHEEYDRVTQ